MADTELTSTPETTSLTIDENSSGIIYSKVIIYDYTQKVTIEEYICKVISEDF